MSNIIFQIENAKNQIKNIDSQLDNIKIIQNTMGMPNIGDQLQNMGIQIINIGIQMINNGIQMPNTGMNTSYLFQQMRNIEMQIHNIVTKLNNNMPMNINNNMGIFMNNNIWIKKKKILFQTAEGVETSLDVYFGTSIGDMLKLYLKETNHPELINTDKIAFLFNAQKLKFDDETKIEEFFKFDDRPKILVIDSVNSSGNMNNNLGISKKNIMFKTAKGVETSLKVDFETSIGDMLKLYLKEMKHPELINTRNTIAFLFNAQKLKFDDKTKIEEFFKYDDRPTIIVVDTSGILYPIY